MLSREIRIREVTHMSLINIRDLTFSYEGSYDNIFEHISLSIDTNWKSGLIGRNGRGKTTFLKLLLGEYKYTGKIESNVEFEYFPYDIKNEDDFTFDVAAEKNPGLEYWQIARELNLLEVSEDILYRPFSALSYGEKVKVMIAVLFTRENSFLLIDEPTNHLDLYGRSRLAEYLNTKKGFILVSHDRDFLDKCADHIIAINKTSIAVQKGNFSTWDENKRRSDAFEISYNEKLRSEIMHLEQAKQRTKNWADISEKRKDECERGENYIGRRPWLGRKSKKMMKRSKSIEQRIDTAVEEKKKLLKDIEHSDKLKLRPIKNMNGTMLELRNVSIFYGDRRITDRVSFSVRSGDRINISGKNGSGKSSILKLIMGEDISHEGEIYKRSGLIISYVSQDTSYLKGRLAEYADENDIDEALFKTILRKLDFDRVQFDKDMSSFSEGQKKKTLIAASLSKPAHLYIWDEPMNYIDVLSRIQIENLIREYSPAMVFVEHDSAFCRKAATETVRL